MNADVAAVPRRVPHATLADLAGLLRDQQARKLDIVVPAAAIRARGGSLLVDGSVPVLREGGVTVSAGEYRPTEVCDGGLAARLGIPAGYLRRLRGEHPGLYDANVNGWLGRDDRSFLLRCLRPSEGSGPGVVRLPVGRLQDHRQSGCADGRAGGDPGGRVPGAGRPV